MTYCPQYPSSFEQQSIEKKLYQQSFIDKLLSEHCENNGFQVKGLKRNVSNLNKYMYLIHKQSSKAKMKIEKENSYYKSAKISGNLSYYNTFLCTTTNKFVLNTYALNHTEVESLSGKVNLLLFRKNTMNTSLSVVKTTNRLLIMLRKLKLNYLLRIILILITT
jgi:hypothetical protein